MKTIETLLEEFNAADTENTYQVGPMHTNHSRAVYMIGKAQILIDTVFPHNPFKPSQEWFWTGHDLTKTEAERVAKQYGGDVEEAYYSESGEEYLVLFHTARGVLSWLLDCKPELLEAVSRATA